MKETNTLTYLAICKLQRLFLDIAFRIYVIKSFFFIIYKMQAPILLANIRVGKKVLIGTYILPYFTHL
jgi:hypothetical protein